MILILQVSQSRCIYYVVSWLIISSMALIELLIKCEGASQALFES